MTCNIPFKNANANRWDHLDLDLMTLVRSHRFIFSITFKTLSQMLYFEKCFKKLKCIVYGGSDAPNMRYRRGHKQLFEKVVFLVPSIVQYTQNTVWHSRSFQVLSIDTTLAPISCALWLPILLGFFINKVHVLCDRNNWGSCNIKQQFQIDPMYL